MFVPKFGPKITIDQGKGYCREEREKRERRERESMELTTPPVTNNLHPIARMSTMTGDELKKL